MKILVCKHAPAEGMGYFEELFAKRGINYEYQEVYQDSRPRPLEDYQGLILMGGPMNVDQIAEYPFLKLDYDYIATGLKLGMPMLGFCLGGQLLARGLGAEVRRNPQPELGWYDVELVAPENPGIFKGFPHRFKVFQWHGDTFAIPSGAIHLAKSILCKNQAFSWGQNVFGLQFHLEVTATMINDWLTDETTLKEWGFTPDPVKQDTTKYIQEAANLCERLFENFYECLVDYERKKD
ncbi:MAG TPA: type 1 glutamine amidotransferase [Bacillota bacterium]|nr:type 1 glutamine amidotransferase [Bacillota bacterium]